jgi:predicted nucleic acid-binding protein
MTTRGLLDTSVFIARESGRALNVARLPDEVLVSVITVAELQAGVLAASDTDTRSRRLVTLGLTAALEPLPVDLSVVTQWAVLRARLAEESRRINVNDLWIAAIAAANSLTIYSQDADYDSLRAIGGPEVVRV